MCLFLFISSLTAYLAYKSQACSDALDRSNRGSNNLRRSGSNTIRDSRTGSQRDMNVNKIRIQNIAEFLLQLSCLVFETQKYPSSIVAAS